MPEPTKTFPIVYLLDRLAPSETFIRREIDQLRDRGWPLDLRRVSGGAGRLRFTCAACPPAV